MMDEGKLKMVPMNTQWRITPAPAGSWYFQALAPKTQMFTGKQDFLALDLPGLVQLIHSSEWHKPTVIQLLGTKLKTHLFRLRQRSFFTLILNKYANRQKRWNHSADDNCYGLWLEIVLFVASSCSSFPNCIVKEKWKKKNELYFYVGTLWTDTPLKFN